MTNTENNGSRLLTPLNFNEYQIEASKTAIYPNVGNNISYPALGLSGETGEVAEKVKKIYRDKNGIVSEEDKIAIAKELGDVLWYINAICGEIGFPLEIVAEMNLEKLNKRRETNTVNGNGDNREEDKRYVLAKERLRTCSNEELQRILDNLEITCFDTYNYDATEGKYCPIAIAMNLHNTVDNPTDQLIKEEIGKRFVPTNIFKGTPGKFYTTNRREDVINLCKEILDERKSS
jgi:NTP pyrophosphatase (non-canonical NTP hydrolase)